MEVVTLNETAATGSGRDRVRLREKEGWEGVWNGVVVGTG